MDLGICMASHVGDIDYVVRAEELGYSHAWLADSQMLWSDCYAALALAAVRTSTIKLGTGVAISGTRPAPVNAAGIATINALAPGRTFFGVGSGNTARRVMGLPPQRIAEFEQYLRTLIPLLKGEEAQHTFAGATHPIRHIMPDKGFVNFEDPIPLYISGFGPRSLGLAGMYGDGAVIGATGESSLGSMWHMVQAGAREAGRELAPGADYYTTALTTMAVLDDGEAVDSDRVKSECGAMAMAAVHYSYDQFRNFGHQPPNHLAGIWDDYTGLLAGIPEERLHQRIHAGHNCWVLPEEECFLTPEVLSASCMIGTPEQLIERLHGLAGDGLNQVMILPNFDTRFQVLERVARDILPHVQQA
jgi:alkanesulfonate monooxygenase SsuD/methylene tetrahydromethanopterin reductase-like flavin-dependent oxidoreductase (luciferase family)